MTRRHKTEGSNECKSFVTALFSSSLIIWCALAVRAYIEGGDIKELLQEYLEKPTPDVQAAILEGVPFMGEFQEGAGVCSV